MNESADPGMVINATPAAEGSLQLRTDGLSRVGYPELEVVGVPEAQRDNATALVNAVARYVGQQRYVAAGERLEIRGPIASMVVGLEAASVSGKKKGFFGRMLSGRAKVLRLVEPAESMEHPKTLLSTVMLWRAAELLDRDEVDKAKQELLASIAYFPGAPAARADAPQLRVPFNWENHLSYSMMATVDGDHAGDWLEKAFARADTLEYDRLGDPGEDLARESIEALLQTTRIIVDHNMGTHRLDEEAPGVVMLMSPIWFHAAEANGTSVAERTATVLPACCADYYYRGAVAEQITNSDELHQLVAETVRAHAARPARLALFVEEVRRLYASGENVQMTDESTPPYVLAAQALSLLLADAGRRLAAGLTLDELRVAYALEEDGARAEQAAKKMAALAEAEHAAFLALVKESPEDADGDDDDDLVDDDGDNQP